MIIFINNGNYAYRFEKYEIILRKQKKYVIIDIFNKEEMKQYRIKITEEEIYQDNYFQSIKTEYNVLELFGLSNIELFMILMDNSIKKNIYKIEWFKISPTNIRDDVIKLNVIISQTLELSFTLDFIGYI